MSPSDQINIPHGTNYGYNGWRCRCDLCRQAKNETAARNGSNLRVGKRADQNGERMLSEPSEPGRRAMSHSDQTDSPRRFTRSAYTLDGSRFEVWPDEEHGRIWIEVDGRPYWLNIGHVEQLQAALGAAISYLAAGRYVG